MSSYDAKLGLPEQPQLPLPVRVVTTGDNITLHVGDALIADWPLEQVSITREERGFRIVADGEDLIVDITEANRFAMEMGITDAGPVETLSGHGWDARGGSPSQPADSPPLQLRGVRGPRTVGVVRLPGCGLREGHT